MGTILKLPTRHQITDTVQVLQPGRRAIQGVVVQILFDATTVKYMVQTRNGCQWYKSNEVIKPFVTVHSIASNQ